MKLIVFIVVLPCETGGPVSNSMLLDGASTINVARQAPMLN